MPYQNETVPYLVSTWQDSDGSEIRQLHLGLTPLQPSGLLALMKGIAPLPNSASCIRDIKSDMVQVFNCHHDYPIRYNLAGMHRGAFDVAWRVMSNQAKPFYDALPYRYAGPHDTLIPGNKNLNSVIGSVSNKKIRAGYFERVREDRDMLVGTVEFSETGNAVLSPKPFIVMPDRNNEPTYLKTAAFKLSDGVVPQKTQGLTEDGIGTILIDRLGKYIALWETHHVPNRGIVPAIRWRKERDGALQLLHGEPKEEDLIVGRETWTAIHLSVVGAMMLAALSPEISSQWAERQGFGAKSKREQAMGPLQASLLSVIHANELLRGDFVQHVESQLA